MSSVVVANFLPSTKGLHFANSFPNEPDLTIDLGVAHVPIGDASNGLCGGMVFAACDYFQAGMAPPPDTEAPGPDTPLFSFLVRRLFDSFNLPAGPATYLLLMSPAMPDGDVRFGPITLRGRSWRMIHREWPLIRTDLDAGRLCPLGLVKVKSANPLDLAKDYQLLAYGYDLEGTELSLRLYDPNSPDDDTVTLRLDTADPTRAVTLTMAPVASDIPEVFCFFRVTYRPAPPPGIE